MSMNKLKVSTVAMCAVLVVGCGTKQGTGSLIGAGGGALIGGIIGKFAGNTIVGAAIGSAVGAGTGALIGRHMDKVAEQAKLIESAKVEKVTDANGLEAVKVTFDSGILFATNRSDLSAESKTSLAKFSNTLKQNNMLYIDIYGHTDATGNDGINIPLSNERARSVETYLKSCGVQASQFKIISGKGSSEPVVATNKACKENRRVEIYLYASPAMVDAANAGTLK